MRNVYLVGMPGSGKSAIGKRVSEILGWEFCDLDAKVVQMSGEVDVNQIFSKRGMQYFRSLEKKALREISGQEHVIVATGGGVVLDDDNINTMLTTGRTVFVDVSIDTLKQRIDVGTRPLVQDIGAALESMYWNRIDLYHRAGGVVLDNNGKLEDGAQELACAIDSNAAQADASKK